MKHYHYQDGVTYGKLTIRATDHRASFAGNEHRIVLKSENEAEFIGWPDPTDKRNSEHWKPGIDRPLLYPKFAWEAI